MPKGGRFWLEKPLVVQVRVTGIEDGLLGSSCNLANSL